ncbi:MAG: hypothetical protein H6541_12945 [Lentimicrobiaceae bacterium]|nr:hypothetical protein [Lentimicrobiaceae bacterium]MCB9024295.1 hypothetical protein [Lentimicrobiaceae bacterium]MCO5264740.1 hypothetical protein [Lentimicrobium sp.]HPG33042.1 hypothetical protein [Lentimicrobium sp.]
MKLKYLLLIVFLWGSLDSGALGNSQTSGAKADRAFYYNKYRSVRDTMTVNSWINLKRLSDNLEQVVKIDQQFIDSLRYQQKSDSAALAHVTQLTQKYDELNANFKIINERSKRDFRIIFYLKIAAGILAFIILLAIMVIYNKKVVARRYKDEGEHYEALAEERQQQLDLLDAELKKLKIREIGFREELEKGMQNHQERLLFLQNKCSTLEAENQKLKAACESMNINYQSVLDESLSVIDIPDDMEELKKLAKSLIDERKSLINLAGKLREQVETANSKYQSIILRFKRLSNELLSE